MGLNLSCKTHFKLLCDASIILIFRPSNMRFYFIKIAVNEFHRFEFLVATALGTLTLMMKFSRMSFLRQFRRYSAETAMRIAWKMYL
jgi:hypothetical protein